MKTVEELTERFRGEGLKVTPQRQAIFRVLNAADDHPTAESVYHEVSADMPTISLRTVYQTLNDLAARGELAAIDLGTGSTRFDPNLVPHHHLVCEACGRVDDLDHDFPGVTLPAENRFGFEVATTEVVFRGRCADCVTGADGPAPDPSHKQPGDPHPNG